MAGVSVSFTAILTDFSTGLRTAVGQLENATGQMTRNLEQMNTRMHGIGRSIGGSLTAMFSLAAIAAFVSKAKDAVTEAESAFRGLEAVANYSGVGIGRAMEEAGKLAADGLLTTAEASKSLQNLLSRGYSLDQAVNTLNRLKDAAAYNRAGHLSMGEAVMTATEGLKNENSILVDNAGVTKNVSKMWEEYAAQHGKAVTALTQAEKIQAEYNGVMKETEAQVGNAARASEGLQGQSAKLDSQFKNLMVSVGEALTPALVKLTEAAQWTIDKFDLFVRLIQISGAQLAKWAADVGAIWSSIRSWDFGNLNKKLELNAQVLRDQVDEIMNKKPGGSFQAAPDSGKRRDPKDLETSTKKDKGTKGSEDARIKQWNSELEREKQLWLKKQAEADTFYEFGYQKEADFWAKVKGRQDLSAHERAEAEGKYYGAVNNLRRQDFDEHIAALEQEKTQYQNNLYGQLEIAQRVAEEKKKFGESSKEYRAAQNDIVAIEQQIAQKQLEIKRDTVNKKTEMALFEVEERQRDAQLQQDLGLTTKQQLLEQERQFEAEKFEIRRAALDEQIALEADNPQMNPEKLRELHGQIEDLEREHQQRLGEIRREQTVESTKNWTGMVQTMQSGFESILKQFMQGTLTIGGLIKGLFMAVADAVTGALAKMAAKWLIDNLIMKSVGKATALSNISAKAAEAGAAGTASWAGAPWPINMGAPAFGAAMAAASASYAAGVASAAGGFDIPSGVNPLTQLHEREMVLPAHLADKVRNITDDGPGGGPGINVHVHAIDARGVRKLFMENGGAIADAMRAQFRNFHPAMAR